MTRFVLVSVLIAFTTLLAAARPPHHAQNQNPRVPGTPAPPPHHAQNQKPSVLGAPAPRAVAPLTPEDRSRALHDPHDSLWSQPAPSMYRVHIETTKGIILLDVTRALAPRGADRFYHLVQVGFYDNSRFFRVISGRFAQFG